MPHFKANLKLCALLAFLLCSMASNAVSNDDPPSPKESAKDKGNTLYNQSIIAFEKNDVKEFNRIYEEMKRLKQTDVIRSQDLFTEVNYHIINGDYGRALHLADWLPADTCAERKALIYHRMGDNEKAYEYMTQYKHIFDSITRTSHSSVVANLYLRMNNDRLRLEQEMLRHQNTRLHNLFYFAAAIAVILVLLYLFFKGRRIIKRLRHNDTDYGKEDAKQTLKELNELSFYESKREMPLTTTIRVNELCNRLTTVAQEYCNKGVTSIFQTELPDNFEIKSNREALEKLLTHLLSDATQYAYDGIIKLGCADLGEKVLFTVSDTSSSPSKRPKESLNLSICQSITRLLKGHIWQDSKHTNGTNYCIELSIAPKQS